MTGQADNAHVVCKIFSTELSAQSQLFRRDLQFFFHFNIAERPAKFIAFGGEIVVIFCGCQFYSFQVGLGRGAADDKC